MASIQIRGIDELQRKLGNAAANRTLMRPMNRAVLRIQRNMAEYPPPRPGSRYIRGFGMEGGPRTSERLGQSWTTKVKPSGNGVTGTIGTNVSYAPWVQSERFQAWMHKGRWTNTDEKTVERLRTTIIEDFQRAIDRALEGK